MKTEPTLYASLIGPLLGIYYPLPTNDEIEARFMLNSSKLDRLWCSIYTADEAEAQIAEFGGIKLPRSYALQLDYDTHLVSMGMEMIAKARAEREAQAKN